MKKYIVLSAVFILLAFIISGCKKSGNNEASETDAKDSTTSAPTDKPTAAATQAPTVAPTAAAAGAAYDAFIDGTYQVKTNVDAENYYVEATVTVEGGKVTVADWTAYDSKAEAAFDGEYYKVFESQGADPLYVQQAKDDWAGSREYAPKFIESQNVNKVDAVSAATWAYVEFEEVMDLALAQATKDIVPVYKDGVYEGQTSIDPDKFYAKATVTVEGGKITKVDWNVYDSSKEDALFDQDYISKMTGWEKGQCSATYNGMGGYADKLIATQNLYQVDAVSGATWANIKFRQAVDSALQNAK